MDLSVTIPSRNEEFLRETVADLVKNRRGNTEIIVGLDGQWADPSFPQYPEVNVVYYPESIGQRAMTNQCVKLAKGKYIMKCDAHCAFDEGFDVKMMEAFKEAGDNVVMAPGMRNLWVYDWKCPVCGFKVYQDKVSICPPNKRHPEPVQMKKKMLWIAKTNPFSTAYCFDPEPHFQYMNLKNRKSYQDGVIIGYDLSISPSFLSADSLKQDVPSSVIGSQPSSFASVISLLTDLARSHPFPIDPNSSSGRKKVSSDTVSLPPIDNGESIGSSKILGIGDKLEMQGVTTSPIFTEMVNNGDVSAPSSGNTIDKPSIEETMYHFMFSEVGTVSITPPLELTTPVPTTRHRINSDVVDHLNSILGGEFIYNEKGGSFHNGSVALTPIYRKDINESLSLQGSCFMCTKDKYWELGICDEDFGSWGSQGIEVACKFWLSGGRVLINRKTWYAHLFRTKGEIFGFPYKLSGHQVQDAKKKARDLFFNNKWDKAIHPLSWLVRRFSPVTGWSEDEIKKLEENERSVKQHELHP